MTSVRIKVAIGIAILVLGLQVFGANPEKTQGAGKTVLYGKSEMFAAFLVAYEAHQACWKTQGINLTPQELVVRHYAIHCMYDGANHIRVLFLPESFEVRGGGIAYVVDRKTMKVIERVAEP